MMRESRDGCVAQYLSNDTMRPIDTDTLLNSCNKRAWIWQIRQ